MAFILASFWIGCTTFFCPALVHDAHRLFDLSHTRWNNRNAIDVEKWITRPVDNFTSDRTSIAIFSGFFGFLDKSLRRPVSSLWLLPENPRKIRDGCGRTATSVLDVADGACALNRFPPRGVAEVNRVKRLFSMWRPSLPNRDKKGIAENKSRLRWRGGGTDSTSTW